MMKWVLLHFFPENTEPPRPRGRQPNDYTLTEVRSMPRGHPLLLAIALRHPVEEVAVEATTRIDSRDHLRIVALSAARFVRFAAVRQSRADIDLLVEVAMRDEDSALACHAAHLIESAEHVLKLHGSKHEAVRKIAILKEAIHLADRVTAS